MGPQAAVNAVYYNKIQEVPEGPERQAYVERLRDEYRADIDIHKLAGELIIDAIIPGERLRDEIAARFLRAGDRREPRVPKKHIVPPV
jgi:acetyl-CoA carboxylase carboxyltransferase component